MIKKTLKELAALTGAKIQGDEQCVIEGIGTLQTSRPGQISFLTNTKYRQYLRDTQASAVIVTEQDLEQFTGNALITDDPYFVYAQIAQLFLDEPSLPKGIHPSAVIGQDCHIAASVSIGPNVVIGNCVSIGEGTCIESSCVVGDGCIIGEACHVWANVTLYYGVQLADHIIIHSGAVIGSDGFGNAFHQGQWHKVPQLGSVRIERFVEIGANTTIDRGAIGDTIIKTGVKLDNQIQVAHNVHIGAHTAIAGCAGIAGSSKIGKYCMIGGATAISGHVNITDQVVVTGMSMITNSIKEPGYYSSGTGFMKNREWQKNAVRFRQLDSMARRVQQLEETLHALLEQEKKEGRDE